MARALNIRELPNVSGAGSILRYNYFDNTQNVVVTDGAVSVKVTHRNINLQTTGGFWSEADTTGSSILSVNASGSSSIFGASQKVQPRSYQLLMIIRS